MLSATLNARVRENKIKTTVVAHNLFRFKFFFLLKGLRAGVRRTKSISIDGKTPTNISFASIDNQVMFLNTITYFQQSLASLPNSLIDDEKIAIRKECRKFISKDESLLRKFNK